MATYLYGLLLARNSALVPPHIAGIGGAPLRVLGCGDLGALVSSAGRAPATGTGTVDEIRAHDHALQAVVHHGVTVAAGRFGQSYPSDDECRRAVLAETAPLRDLLDDCDGCVEMRLLMAGREQHSVPPVASAAEGIGAGRAYLEGLRHARDRTTHLGLRDALGPVVRRERVEEIASGRGIVFSHLIERARETEYRDAVAALPALGGITLVGPLALHAFARADPA